MVEFKVNFMVIGAARSATTNISSLLANHPSISFSKPKEPQFFSEDNWRDDIEKYNGLFIKKPNAIYGEGSTNYAKRPYYNKNIVNDIKSYNPDMKFIYIVRHPLDRIVSNYKFDIERGYMNTSFTKAITENPFYIEVSKYYYQIARYLEVFPASNIKIIFFEDFINKQQLVFNDVCEFLEISKIEIDTIKQNNNATSKGTIGHHKYDNPETLAQWVGKIRNYLLRSLNIKTKKISVAIDSDIKEFIFQKLNDDISSFEKLTKRDLSHWRH